MNKKGGLGKGLDAIFGENNAIIEEAAPEVSKEKVESPKIIEKPEEAKVTEIVPNPYQPRKNFDEEKLHELAASIKEHGVVEPLIVRKKGKKYELVAGERRLRAAKIAGLEKVPIVIKEYDNTQLMQIALIENIQRDDLNPIEEANAIFKLMTECKLTQEQVAEKIGRSRPAIANMLRILNMPVETQEYISLGKMSVGQAKVIAGLANQEQQLAVAKQAVEKGWSARIVEDVVRQLKEGKVLQVICEVREKKDKEEKKEPKNKETTIFYKDYENKLIEILGTKVKVQPKKNDKEGKSGVIQIEYYSEEDLNRIYEAMMPREEEVKESGVKRLNV